MSAMASVQAYAGSLQLRMKRKVMESDDQLSFVMLDDLLAELAKLAVAILANPDDMLPTFMESFVSSVFSFLKTAVARTLTRMDQWNVHLAQLYSVQLQRPLLARERFAADVCDPIGLCMKFVFNKSDISELVRRLGIPEQIMLQNRSRFTGSEAFLILLYRLRHAGPLSEMTSVFNRSETAISLIISHLLDFLTAKWSNVLSFDHRRLTAAKLHEYSEYLYHEIGCPLRGVIGFLDGTLRETARPSAMDNDVQRSAFSGYKHRHGLKYQCVVTPDGIIAHSFGPVFARHNDQFVFNESQLVKDMELVDSNWQSLAPDDRPILYGDLGYADSRFIRTGFRDTSRSTDERRFNKYMSSLRILVEWGFLALRSGLVISILIGCNNIFLICYRLQDRQA